MSGAAGGFACEESSGGDDLILEVACKFAPSILDVSPHAEADCPVRKRSLVPSADPCEYCFCFSCDVPVSSCRERDTHIVRAGVFSAGKEMDKEMQDESPDATKDIGSLSKDLEDLAVKEEVVENVAEAKETTATSKIIDSQSIHDRLDMMENLLSSMAKRILKLEIHAFGHAGGQ